VLLQGGGGIHIGIRWAFCSQDYTYYNIKQLLMDHIRVEQRKNATGANSKNKTPSDGGSTINSVGGKDSTKDMEWELEGLRGLWMVKEILRS
jgi:hypothetical protein